MTAYEPADFVIRQGDTAPRISQPLTDPITGAPVEAFGAEVRLHLHGLTIVDDRDLTGATDPLAESGNVVYYDWTTDDTQLAGYYSAEWQLTFGDGRVQTFPNIGVFLVQVVEQVA